MKRTDAADHIANKFSDGTPGVSDATTVEQTWLNAVQDEICNVIEGAGLVVDQNQNDLPGPLPDNGQLLKAVKALIGVGGNPQVFNLLNNQGATDLTGLSWAEATYQAIFFDFTVFRKTATQRKKQQGRMHIFYDSFSDTWDHEIVWYSWDLDAGVTFSLNVVANVVQIRYATDDLSGGTYDGKLRITNLVTIKF